MSTATRVQAMPVDYCGRFADLADASAFRDTITLLVTAARPLAMRHFRTRLAVIRKGDDSPVTIADRQIEAALREIIVQRHPDHGIYGEEHGAERLDARFTWVIDPIDGTKSFITGSPLFGTLIALLVDGHSVLGTIDMPALQETWLGARGEASTLNGHRCATASTELGDAALYATSPDQFSTCDAEKFNALSRRVGLRRFGGDCYAYGLLASGHIQIVAEAGLQPYDYLACAPVIESAGGVITDWDGKRLTLKSDGRVLAAASSNLHAQALDALHSC
jgi:inositol-phosphate phosphatase / L-galactose 1-phosphate phosphatase / histidinol-phosphatase